MPALPKDCYELYATQNEKYKKNTISFEEFLAAVTKVGHLVQLNWGSLKSKDKQEMKCPLFLINPISKITEKTLGEDISTIDKMVKEGYDVYISETIVERWNYPIKKGCKCVYDFSKGDSHLLFLYKKSKITGLLRRI